MKTDNVDILFDKRTVARQLKTGVIDDKAMEKYLKNLPDLAAEAIPVEATLDGEYIENDTSVI